MRAKATCAVALTLLAISVGCHKDVVDPGAFKTAINKYYSGRQECVWSAPMKFPTQADTSKEQETKGFDALTDAGLLTRKTAEKSRFLIGSKQVNDYDLSDKGRSVWVADQTQPGYGNFCFGHFVVKSIDNYTPADANAARYNVTYHEGLVDLPDWANSTEMKAAFQKIASDTSGQPMATATLIRGGDGWVVESVQATAAGS